MYNIIALTWDPPSISAGATVSLDVVMPGATMGDSVVATLAVDLGGLWISARVQALHMVRVTLFNPTGSSINLAPSTLIVKVTKLRI